MEIGQSLLSIAASPILIKNYFPRILVILKILSRKHVPNQQTFSRHIYVLYIDFDAKAKSTDFFSNGQK